MITVRKSTGLKYTIYRKDQDMYIFRFESKSFDNILDKNPDNIPSYTRQIVDELSKFPTEKRHKF